jgi:hypothetical protein
MMSHKNNDRKLHQVIPYTQKQYPAGRGKVLTIAEYETIEKRKRGKKKGYYIIHFDSKSGNSVTIGIFRKKPYPVIFPEGATLHPKRIDELVGAALALSHICKYGKNTVKLGQKRDTRFRITKEALQFYNKKIEAYKRWLKKVK